MELKELYQEIILDHGKNPRNFGKCKDFTSDAKGHNPLCGDKVHIYAQLDKNKKILDLSFEGEGCAISLDSASILTDIMKGKDIKKPIMVYKKYLWLIPANHKTAIPLTAISNAVPKSGWTITRPIGNKIIINEVRIV